MKVSPEDRPETRESLSRRHRMMASIRMHKGWSSSHNIEDILAEMENTKDFSIRSEMEPLVICAPITDMRLDDDATLEGHKIVEKVHVPDPVVLCPVHRGYLIITAWGDEASDPLVYNEKLN